MDEAKRFRKRHNFLLKYLLGDDFSHVDYLISEDGWSKYKPWLEDAFSLLEPSHRFQMSEFYLENKKRYKQTQNVFHGRKALAAVLASDCTGLVDELREIYSEREA